MRVATANASGNHTIFVRVVEVSRSIAHKRSFRRGSFGEIVAPSLKSGGPCLVQIKTGDSLHAVLVPTFDDPVPIDLFLRFLQNDEENIHAALTKFDGEK